MGNTESSEELYQKAGELVLELDKFPKLEIDFYDSLENDLKNKAPEKINKIAIETSADLVKLLIGTEVNASSISAIVENISKKNKEKYYGF